MRSLLCEIKDKWFKSAVTSAKMLTLCVCRNTVDMPVSQQLFHIRPHEASSL